MKDIDFLPEWYKETRRCQSSVQRQYLALGGLFLVMVVWNALAMRSISLASAELAAAEPQRTEAERVCYEFDHLVQQLIDRRQELAGHQDMECRVDVASVLAELSAVIDDRVALESLSVVSEPVAAGSASGPRSGAPAVDPLAGTRGRIQIVMKGLAQDPPAAAALLKAMEASAYFTHVTLVVSRDLDLTDPQALTAADGETPGHGLAFEIRCLLREGGEN